MNLKVIIILIIIACTACKPRTNINTNEQKLAAQIAQEEQDKQEREQTFKQNIPAVSDTMPLWFRYKENRSIAKNNPPLLINVVAARENIKPLKYSELGKSVRYTYLKHPTDSLFFKHGAKILFTKSNIICTTWKGIARFDLQGQYIEMICIDGQKAIYDEKRGSGYVTTELMNKYVGSAGRVSAIGDQIFYRYVNNLKEEAWLMEYNVSPGNQSLLFPSSFEKKNMNGKGTKIAKLPSGRRTGNIFVLDENHWLTKRRKMASSKSGYFMTVHSLSGDTVCSLKDYDPITNFSSSVYRGVERGDIYKLHGKVHVRQNFNDTVYWFESTHRLIPKYVFNLGEKGVSTSEEAITPKYSLVDKYVYSSIVETKGFLFLLYTQDYSCPNNAKTGSLKYNRFVLNKKTGEQFHAYVDAEPYMPNKKKTWPSAPQTNIINDLDFGPSQWPYTQTENGQIYFQISGKDLKKHVNNNQNSLNHTNRKKLEMIATHCKNYDVLLMIIE